MSTSGGGSISEEEVEKVVIEQRVLKLDEVFVYKIPAMRSADGHRAEDWNLAKPLATCSLIANRLDDSLCINIMAERPKANAPPGATESYLFAQSVIQMKSDQKRSHKLEHWVEPVVDSSRYFAMRIRDSKTGREAFIGLGFRERNDATNFRMTMEDYVAALKREEKAQELHRRFEQALEDQSGEGEDGAEQSLPAMSNLSLKEGEKIHINIKGGGGGSKRVAPTKQTPKKGASVGLVGLRRPPPPPPDATTAAAEASTAEHNASNSPEKKEEDDDEWGDFEG